MPKQKSHKGLSKRVKLTARGKVKRHRAGGGHLMSSKTSKRRRRISQPGLVNETILHTVKVKLAK